MAQLYAVLGKRVDEGATHYTTHTRKQYIRTVGARYQQLGTPVIRQDPSTNRTLQYLAQYNGHLIDEIGHANHQKWFLLTNQQEYLSLGHNSGIKS